MEDKSTISTREVAELNTELYVPPLLSESKTISSENRLESNSLVSSDKQNNGRDMSSRKRGISISHKTMPQGTHKTKIMEENTKSSETNSNIRKYVQMVGYIEQSPANGGIQKSLLVGEQANEFDSDQNLPKSLSAMKNIGHFGSKQEQDTRKSGSMRRDSERRSIETSVRVLGNASPLQLHQSLSKSLLTDKDGSPINPYSRMQKSVAKHEPLQSILATVREPKRDRLSRKMSFSTVNEIDNQYTKSVNISSRQEDDSESSEGHSSVDLLYAESTMEGGKLILSKHILNVAVSDLFKVHLCQ